CFLSSRSRHTRFSRDWSSDVCSSDLRDKLLEFLDDEIIDALSYHLRETGVLIRHREEYDRVEGLDDGVVLHLKSGKQLKTDVLRSEERRAGKERSSRRSAERQTRDEQ